jgi:hypothetical protein
MKKYSFLTVFILSFLACSIYPQNWDKLAEESASEIMMVDSVNKLAYPLPYKNDFANRYQLKMAGKIYDLQFANQESRPKFFNWWKLGQYSLSGFSGAMSGHSDYYVRLQGVENNRLHHNYQTFERAGLLLAGATIPLSAKGKTWHIISDIISSWIVYGFCHNGFQNVARGKSWFWQSDYQKKYNTSGFENFASWEWQIGGLILAIIQNYLAYEIL